MFYKFFYSSTGALELLARHRRPNLRRHRAILMSPHRPFRLNAMAYVPPKSRASRWGAVTRATGAQLARLRRIGEVVFSTT